MSTLIIHTPDYQLGREDTKSFEDTFKTGIGKAYAIYKGICGKIHADCEVVLLCKDRMLRAEGRLLKLECAKKDGKPWLTKNGIQRYDVYVKDFKMVPYKSEALNHCGVAVI